jgi:hypothetical protein
MPDVPVRVDYIGPYHHHPTWTWKHEQNATQRATRGRAPTHPTVQYRMLCTRTLNMNERRQGGREYDDSGVAGKLGAVWHRVRRSWVG